MKELTITSEDLLRRVTAEMQQLHDSGAGMRLEIEPAAAFAVVAMCQLALRHPGTKNESGRLAAQFIEYVRAKFEPHAPAIAEAIRRGNEPEHDTPADIPPEAFGGKRPPADELRFYRLIDERIQGRDATTRGLLLLACSHRIPQDLAKIPPSQEYAFCPTCAERAAFTERSRQARENIIIPETAPNTKGRDWVRERFEKAAAEPPEMEQERALLRRLLNSRDPLENARLTFGHDKHQIIFQRIMDLHERGEPVDCPALANELMKNGELQAVGGLTYLVTLYEPPQHDELRPATRDPFDGFLNCPYCGFSQPAPLEKVDLYICGNCGRTVDGGPPA